MVSQKVVGRYAPSPTGELHFGNLRTALLAWLHARVQGGQFLMRMEDIDTPRVVAGSDKQILQDLEWLGLDWDGEVVYQSRRTDLYQHALESLSKQDLTYPCFCSRKEIQQSSSAPHGSSVVYSGRCAKLSSAEVEQRRLHKSPSIRLRVNGDLRSSCGDFVVRRADGLFAYQLVVVVDDLDQGITEVVRGEDLASSTARQQYLANLINPNQVSIAYFHAPLMMDNRGDKMSKRDGSLSIREWQVENKSSQALVAMLAKSSGLPIEVEELSARELLASINLQSLQCALNEYPADS